VSRHPASFAVHFWCVAFALAMLFVGALNLKRIADDVHAIRQSLAVPAVQDADKHGVGEFEKGAEK
jgi:hypothetical protein